MGVVGVAGSLTLILASVSLSDATSGDGVAVGKLLPLSVTDVIMEVAADASVVVKREASLATVSVQGQLEMIEDW